MYTHRHAFYYSICHNLWCLKAFFLFLLCVHLVCLLVPTVSLALSSVSAHHLCCRKWNWIHKWISNWIAVRPQISREVCDVFWLGSRDQWEEWQRMEVHVSSKCYGKQGSDPQNNYKMTALAVTCHVRWGRAVTWMGNKCFSYLSLCNKLPQT